MKGKDKAIAEEYDLAFGANGQDSYTNDLDALCKGSGEKLKVFTKLILLYLRNPDAVPSIFYRFSWRRLRTGR